MFEFTVPDGDWDFNPDTRQYTMKKLVFTEKKKKVALAVAKEFIADGTAFTMTFKDKRCN